MFTRPPRPKTKNEELQRSYDNAMQALDDFRSAACYFWTTESPIEYTDMCEQIGKLRNDFRQNTFFVLPSARHV